MDADARNAGGANAGKVYVPELVGMTVPAARRAGHNAGLVVTSADLDGTPLGGLTWPGVWVVTAQRPAAGGRADRWDVVVIEFQKVRDSETRDR